MPHYYFHSKNGEDVDATGIDLADDGAARVEAIRYAGDQLSDSPDLLQDGHTFRVEVTNEERDWLFSIVMLAVDAPKEAAH